MSKLTKEQLQTMDADEVFDALGNIAGTYISRNELCESIMPLAFERNLNILSPDSQQVDWNVFDNHGVGNVYDENPLRAIACCLILVLQEGK